jgi:hypothetical protein
MNGSLGWISLNQQTLNSPDKWKLILRVGDLSICFFLSSSYLKIGKIKGTQSRNATSFKFPSKWDCRP